MDRTMIVRGLGKASAKPDRILIPLTLTAKDMDYQRMMELANARYGALQAALAHCGIAPEELKTTNLNIDTSYVGEHDERGAYTQRFDGYVCTHESKVEFDLDLALLARVMDALAKSAAEPAYSIRFTVKEPEGMMRQALESAAQNARAKAEILAAASRVELGELVRVDYDFTDASFFSPTQVNRAAKLMHAESTAPDVAPEDVHVSQTVSFMWEIG